MSPGIGMPELLVVLVLALVVVGPQQLPVMMRRVGQLMNQARGLAKEFQNSFEEIGRETELSELRKEIEALKQANPVNQIKGEFDKVAKDVQSETLAKPDAPAKADAPAKPDESAKVEAPKKTAAASKSGRIDG
ncbi:Sec-independent protein translocase protein TatB [Maricaulis alexandrii]|jgi:sec-independent protein translocase protein TatB|uniref:Sec-independent protein translocase protein TatB n=1 Tax=Maricaulis alexandrii TaxID=2570354 RepID=UPI0011097F43|nr:Sec-independent protein translocase protein TatB [Maricaulis alexandrii]